MIKFLLDRKLNDKKALNRFGMQMQARFLDKRKKWGFAWQVVPITDLEASYQRAIIKGDLHNVALCAMMLSIRKEQGDGKEDD